MTDEVRYVPLDRLREFTARVFAQLGMPAADAGTAADVLAASDSRGIDSHGVARLRAYLDLFRAGRMNTRPSIRVVRELPGTATVDGDNGIGLVVGPWANDLCLAKAEAVGAAAVAVRNTNHYGIAGYYPLRALARGLIGWSMTNSSKLVAPLGGAERMLGTNPIAIAFPCETEPPVVIDLATSAVAFGKIEIAARQGRPIPSGWAIDRDGNTADAPDRMWDGGRCCHLAAPVTPAGTRGSASGRWWTSSPAS